MGIRFFSGLVINKDPGIPGVKGSLNFAPVLNPQVPCNCFGDAPGIITHGGNA
jgi:hypothetical protein